MLLLVPDSWLVGAYLLSTSLQSVKCDIIVDGPCKPSGQWQWPIPFISSHLDYCNSLPQGLQDTLLCKLQSAPHVWSLADEDATISALRLLHCFQFDVASSSQSTSLCPDKHLSTWLMSAGSCLRRVDVLCGQPMSWHAWCHGHKTVTWSTLATVSGTWIQLQTV